MPHISKKKIRRETYRKLNKKLLATFESSYTSRNFPKFFGELFTKTEKVMLTKRLVIILLLSKEIPQHRIVTALKVSPSTVAKMSLKLEIGKYNEIVKALETKKGGFVELIEFILSGGGLMPPIAGRGRWKRIFKKF